MTILKNIVGGEFDKELIPLLEELNKAGIKTFASCTGHGKEYAFIAISMKSIQVVEADGYDLIIRWPFKGEYPMRYQELDERRNNEALPER